MARRPPVTARDHPPDYVHDQDRGTLDYEPSWKNYSYHTVRIPGGTVVRACNFTQAFPARPIVTLLGPNPVVTFEDCNFTNVRITPGMVLVRCTVIERDPDAPDVEPPPV